VICAAVIVDGLAAPIGFEVRCSKHRCSDMGYASSSPNRRNAMKLTSTAHRKQSQITFKKSALVLMAAATTALFFTPAAARKAGGDPTSSGKAFVSKTNSGVKSSGTPKPKKTYRPGRPTYGSSL